MRGEVSSGYGDEQQQHHCGLFGRGQGFVSACEMSMRAEGVVNACEMSWSMQSQCRLVAVHAVLGAVTILLLLCSPTMVAGTTSLRDSDALYELKKTALDQQRVSNQMFWQASDPCDGWEGVTCQPEAGNERVVSALVLNGTQLGGSLTPKIGNLQDMVTLILTNNSLHGPLPPELGMLSRLQTLVLSHNLFNGSAPDQLQDLHNLRKLDLSYNNISVPLQFSLNGSAVEVTVQPQMCANGSFCYSNSSPGPMMAEIAGAPADKANDTSAFTFAVIIVSALSASALVALSLAVLYYCWIRKKTVDEFGKRMPEVYKESHRDHPMPVGSIDAAGAVPQVFTYRALQLATNNFSPANIVGEGGFGSVYRAVLPNGIVAAVKRLDRTGRQGEREFKVEVYMLSSLSSPYLLRMIGYCADLDHRLLVYEYMPNGSVQEHLHSDGRQGDAAVIDWNTRLRIALDAARGLEYLHEKANPPVIHRDFKSSNVLLDQNYCAKVSDFGLAKLGPERAGGHVSTRVLGTQGYVAPEYALTGHLTTKSDVYSYGVVLLELLTGRLPVDSKRPMGESVLVSWALPMLNDREQVMKMVDPALQGQFTMKDLVQVAAVATTCVQQEAEYRPLMTDVVQSLVPLVKTKTKPLSMSQWPESHVEMSGPSKVSPEDTITPV